MRTLKSLAILIAALALLLVPGTATAKSRDRDHDKLPDRWEKRHHLSTKKKSARKDSDRDGLNNLCEYRAKSKPRRKDSDRDRRLDGDEDPDRDGVDNRNECREKTKPRRRDTDRDRTPDGREDRDRDGLANADEDRSGNDPIDKDTDDDGVSDGSELAGVVASYKNGVLTIDLANGGSATGRVNGDTDIACETEREAESGHTGGRLVKLAAVDPEDEEEGEGEEDGGEPPLDLPDPSDLIDPEDDDDSDGEDPGPGADMGSCPAGAVKPGAVVHSAKLQPGGVFEEIALVL